MKERSDRDTLKNHDEEAVYRDLARFLDRLPGGFPSTPDGVELRILRRLFTPEQAELALRLTLLAEEAPVIARRARRPVDEVVPLLEEMTERGLIYRIRHRGREPRYMASQFAIGIWEFNVDRLTPDLIRDVNEYMPTLFDLEQWRISPQLRTVPVGRSLDVNLQVWPYENAVELLKTHNRFLEAPCICRQERRMMGEGCDKPEGLCLVLGNGVDYYQSRGIGREIDREEAIRLLKRADEVGLVLQPSYSKKIANICCCCSCCCQVLKNYRRHPRPAEMVASPFRIKAAPEHCIGCGACIPRCPMEALSLREGVAIPDLDRCIGCGLCVSVCPTNALSLERRPDRKKVEIPENLTQAYIQRGRTRGSMKPHQLLGMWLRSRVDRLLAGRTRASSR